MPRKIATSVCNLDDNFSAMGQDACPMCGSLLGENGESDRAEHGDLEIVRKLAAFMADDWKAACIVLLYVAMPNESIKVISRHIILSDAAICEARQRAAERFPELSGMLGLKTPRAIARQAHFEQKKQPSPQGELFK